MAEVVVPTLILGAGLAGLACARGLGQDYRILEQEARVGGLAVTDHHDGFFFDRAGHWLHLRDDRTRTLVEELLGGDQLSVERQARIYSQGVLTRYPFQANTHGLPPETVRDCLIGFVEAWERRRKGAGRPANFEEFIHHHLGWGIARHFMVPYNRKLWGVPLRELDSSWCGRFVPRPSLEEVLGGAAGCPVEGLGYNARFVYPRVGGIGVLAERLAASLTVPVELSCAATAIDPHRREVTTSTGERIPYETLVSSLPLPTLIRLLTSAPDEVRDAALRLRASTVVCVNLGVRGPALYGVHWVYVPEPEFPFYRVGSYSNAVPGLAPEGCSSLYVETSFPPGEAPHDEARLLAEVQAGLLRMGALTPENEPCAVQVQVLRDAYVLFDGARDRAVSLLGDFLRKTAGIHTIGRYGRWIYNSMEDSLLDGLETARLLNTLRQNSTPDLAVPLGSHDLHER
ncbi:MAG: FAD-dependent oxidoreductase [Myxococcota bacterium]|jgi:protoporphyrinogen oxidase|nr:FAD-dependent oxidoreductase [Myxococcota bacterium]